MTALSIKPRAGADHEPIGDAELHWLMNAIRTNRFLPEPNPDSVFVGDGDFRAIGAEFLHHLVRLGGLMREHRVLDVGSGLGRLAVPLTQYLDPSASYLGLDPVREGIAWCQNAITPAYANFRFRHLDIAHDIYNPGGLKRGETLVLPVGDASIDFAFMVSVVTHLPASHVEVYARELARVLAPGGRLLVTSFIIDAEARSSGCDPRYHFQRSGAGPDWHVDPEAPFGAVGFDAGWLEKTLVEAGLAVRLTSLGHWRGRPSAHFQDIMVVEKPGSNS
jgi:SAM-dependent methyltransferase